MTTQHYSKETAIEINKNEYNVACELGCRLYYPEYAEILTFKRLKDMSKKEINLALVGLLAKGLIKRQGKNFIVIYKLAHATSAFRRANDL